jgi:hypothetical protein
LDDTWWGLLPPLSLGSLQAIINEGGRGTSFFGCLVLGFFYTNLFRIVGEVHTFFAFALDLPLPLVCFPFALFFIPQFRRPSTKASFYSYE